MKQEAEDMTGYPKGREGVKHDYSEDFGSTGWGAQHNKFKLILGIVFHKNRSWWVREVWDQSRVWLAVSEGPRVWPSPAQMSVTLLHWLCLSQQCFGYTGGTNSTDGLESCAYTSYSAFTSNALTNCCCALFCYRQLGCNSAVPPPNMAPL